MKFNIVKTACLLMVLLVAVVGLASIVAALPVSVENIKVNGDIIEAGQRLEVERYDNLDIRVKFQALADAHNVRISAFIQGFEQRLIVDESEIFDIKQGNTYVKGLTLKLPSGMERDDYVMRITMSDRTGALIEYKISLDVNTARHQVEIDDVSFSPGTTVEAGRSLLTTIRLDNNGQRDEEVKVTVSIPELGISQVDYIDLIESDDSKTSEELFLRIPRCAKQGDYTLVIRVDYNDFNSIEQTQRTVFVKEGDFCGENNNNEGPTKIILGSSVQTLSAGEKGIYPVTVTNQGSKAKTYALVVEGANDFAEVQVSPSNVMQLAGGESGTVFLFVNPKPDVSGDKQFILTVQEDGSILKQVTLAASIKEDSSWKGLRKGLEIALIALVVILVILGLVIGVSRLKENQEFRELQEGDDKDFY